MTETTPATEGGARSAAAGIHKGWPSGPSAESIGGQVNRWKAVAIAATVAGLSAIWYLPYPFRTLMGDDLYLDYNAHTGGYASGFLVSFTQTIGDKFRPVVAPALFLVTHLFRGNYGAYRVGDLLLQVSCVCLFGYLVWRLTRGRWLITAGAMVAATISRYDAYAVLQVLGLMESAALAFVLLTVICAERTYREQKWVWLLAANGAYLLAEFSHERFLVVGPFLFLAGLLAPIRFRSVITRFTLASIPLVIAFANYAVKAWVVHINFFTGGGGQAEHFSLSQFMGFMGDGLKSIVGYNTGPAYLSGQDAISLGTIGKFVAAAFAVPLTVILVVAVVADLLGFRHELVSLRKYVLALALFLPILASASITFRQEYRWLYAPFLVLLLGASWALAELRFPRFVVIALTALLFGGSFVVDGYYHQYLTNTYFMTAEALADQVHLEVIDEHRPLLSTTTVFFVTQDPTFAQFDLANGRFFAIYAPEASMDVRYVANIEAVCQAVFTRADTLVYTVTPTEVVDTTADAMTRCR